MEPSNKSNFLFRRILIMENIKKSTLLISLILLPVLSFGSLAIAVDVDWTRIGSSTGDLPAPSDGKQQTCCLVLDIDKDGIDDFVIGERTRTPSVVWYKYNGKGWDKFIIDNSRLNPEAGGDFCDIDTDGDLDIVFGQDGSGNSIWWWERGQISID